MIGERCPRCDSINLRVVASGKYIPSSIHPYPPTRMEWYRIECGYCLLGTAQYETRRGADRAWREMCTDRRWSV